jgi:hypothetical protein
MSSCGDTPRLVRIHHRLRTFSFAMMFVATGLHIHDKDYGPLAWTLLALLFLWACMPRRCSFRSG